MCCAMMPRLFKCEHVCLKYRLLNFVSIFGEHPVFKSFNSGLLIECGVIYVSGWFCSCGECCGYECGCHCDRGYDCNCDCSCDYTTVTV